ncbi:MAG: HlyD family type I secretion periplasmic adaptor subunit [Alphaproteobacteria bacterium]|nr:HlyD family type I secretion periplasmic adaptor subunit [Alphaproteobacteria bacterium]
MTNYSTNDDSEVLELPDLKKQPSRTNAITIRTINAIDTSTKYLLAKEGSTENELLNLAHGPIHFGLWVILTFFVILGGWAAFAPLHSASVAEGVVVVGSNKKTIQHLEGGVIDKILVKEGQIVKKGQALIVLNQTSAKAKTQLLVTQILADQALEARLIAERDGKPTINFGSNIEKYKNNPTIANYIDNQKRIFESRMLELHGQVGVFEQKIHQSNDEIRGLSAQEQSALAQIDLTREEIATVQQLLAQGNANKPRLLSLQRNEAELVGMRGEYLASMAKAKQAITESQIQIQNIKSNRLNEVITELRDTQSKISDLVEQIRASSDILSRITITSPQDGTITGLKYFTEGGVIKPGDAIMDLVPLDDQMVVEARVSPLDIDIVHPGLTARVQLSAFKTRRVPKVDGKVIYVSADRFTDEQSGKAYYKARIVLNADKLQKLAKNHVDLYPGMPATVFIDVGSQTFLAYLLEPLTDSFHRAFSEY